MKGCAKTKEKMSRLNKTNELHEELQDFLEKVPFKIKTSGLPEDLWSTINLEHSNFYLHHLSCLTEYISSKQTTEKFNLHVYVLEKIDTQEFRWSVELCPSSPERFTFDNFFEMVRFYYDRLQTNQKIPRWQIERAKQREGVLINPEHYHENFSAALIHEFERWKNGLIKLWLRETPKRNELSGYKNLKWKEVLEVLAEMSGASPENIHCMFIPSATLEEHLEETVEETSKKNIKAFMTAPIQNDSLFWLTLKPTNDLEDWYFEISTKATELQEKAVELTDWSDSLNDQFEIYGDVETCFEGTQEFNKDFVASWLPTIVEAGEKIKAN